MKRKQLIEIGILTVALISGYKAFMSLFDFFVVLIYQLSEDSDYEYYGRPGPFWEILRYLFITLLYFVMFYILIKKTSKIASYIDSKNDASIINLKIDSTYILYIILVALCIYTIIIQLPTIVLFGFDYFKAALSGKNDELKSLINTNSYYNFKSGAVQIILTLVILYFAKPISAFFNKQVKRDNPVIETDPVS